MGLCGQLQREHRPTSAPEAARPPWKALPGRTETLRLAQGAGS